MPRAGLSVLIFSLLPRGRPPDGTIVPDEAVRGMIGDVRPEVVGEAACRRAIAYRPVKTHLPVFAGPCPTEVPFADAGRFAPTVDNERSNPGSISLPRPRSANSDHFLSGNYGHLWGCDFR